MKEKLFVLIRLLIVLVCIANTQWHFANKVGTSILYLLTAYVIVYEILDSHKKIREHRLKTKKK